MEKISAEQKWLKRIANIKWANGYECRKCGCKDFYNISRNYSRRCKDKKCNYEETVLLGTALQDSKISISIKMDLLYYLRKNIWSSQRIPITKLEERFGIRENTITLFFKNIYLFMEANGTHLGGDTYRELDSNDISPTDKFCKGLVGEQAEIYSCLHGLLTIPGGAERSKKGVLHLLVTARDNMDWFE